MTKFLKEHTVSKLDFVNRTHKRQLTKWLQMLRLKKPRGTNSAGAQLFADSLVHSLKLCHIRRRRHNPDNDIDYINERNMKFNQKCERFYGEYTKVSLAHCF